MSLVGWFRDWRERRSALAEMRDLRTHNEAILLDQNQNPLNLARLCLDAGEPEEAATQWERARRQLPDAVVTSPMSLDILLRLNRLDEAEQLMQERHKRLPADNQCLIGLAKIAELRGDFAEAGQRWQFVRRRVADDVEPYIGVARCLIEQGALDEGEAELQRALRMDPISHGALVALARLADRRRDWPVAIERWRHLAEKFDDAPAFASAAKAMLELDRFDDAEAYLETPSRIYPLHLEIALARTYVAQRRGDPAAAADRWARIRAIDPFFHPGYYEGARCLTEADRHAEADAVYDAAIERFSDQAWPLLNQAMLAHARADWNAAIARWELLRARFPQQEEGYSFGAGALRAAGRNDEAEALRRPA